MSTVLEFLLLSLQFVSKVTVFPAATPVGTVFASAICTI